MNQHQIPGLEVTEVHSAAAPLTGGLLNPKFEYTPAIHTDIRKRFERIRQEQQAARAFREVKRDGN